jgi:hypothetical protein
MDDTLYPPGANFNSTRFDIENEISYIEAMIGTLRPEDAGLRAHYEHTLNNLYARLTQYSAPSTIYQPSAAPSPGESAASSSRKRSRDVSNDASMFASPAGSPGTPMSMEYPGYQAANMPRPVKREEPTMTDYIDLTVDEPMMMPPNPRAVDPFPELIHAYQPDQIPQPADAFSQEWLGQEELAQFLVAPTPAGNAYAYGGNVGNFGNVGNPPVAPQMPHMYPMARPVPVPHRNLADELFGNDSDDDVELAGSAGPEAVQDLIENIRHQDELQPEAREQTPKAMCSTLMEHQKIALTWLLKMERGKSKGSILADEVSAHHLIAFS